MKSIRAIVAGAMLASVLSASVVIAAESVGSAPSTGSTSSPQIAGEWNFTSKFEAMTSDATMTITKNAEGKYAGTWSAQ